LLRAGARGLTSRICPASRHQTPDTAGTLRSVLGQRGKGHARRHGASANLSRARFVPGLVGSRREPRSGLEWVRGAWRGHTIRCSKYL